MTLAPAYQGISGGLAQAVQEGPLGGRLFAHSQAALAQSLPGLGSIDPPSMHRLTIVYRTAAPNDDFLQREMARRLS
jgi:hypothetical protein